MSGLECDVQRRSNLGSVVSQANGDDIRLVPQVRYLNLDRCRDTDNGGIRRRQRGDRGIVHWRAGRLSDVDERLAAPATHFSMIDEPLSNLGDAAGRIVEGVQGGRAGEGGVCFAGPVCLRVPAVVVRRVDVDPWAVDVHHWAVVTERCSGIVRAVVGDRTVATGFSIAVGDRADGDRLRVGSGERP